MDVRSALKEQYHGGLAMLRQCVERCPDDLWTSGEHPRTYWRIAYHVCFYVHLYLGQNEDAFRQWPKHRRECVSLDDGPEAEPYSRAEIIEYIDHIDGLIDSTVDSLDLETEETGFAWYPDMTKLSHEFMSLRHLQGHVGQLSELLMTRDIDIDWIEKIPRLD